ncbi:Basic proline-rich protein precursor [Carbonactinospora thermoautotrophica]|uniref:Basic proline-rich protein n=1 Tax=Carbonactinospora thermoautotrophica TaxID=1469144 RepID=A0A132MYB5_9ACTN|nr:Basic proline-rich protein precursor [Carbonactinospora thermoautotrophica]
MRPSVRHGTHQQHAPVGDPRCADPVRRLGRSGAVELPHGPVLGTAATVPHGPNVAPRPAPPPVALLMPEFVVRHLAPRTDRRRGTRGRRTRRPRRVRPARTWVAPAKDGPARPFVSRAEENRSTRSRPRDPIPAATCGRPGRGQGRALRADTPGRGRPPRGDGSAYTAVRDDPATAGSGESPSAPRSGAGTEDLDEARAADPAPYATEPPVAGRAPTGTGARVRQTREVPDGTDGALASGPTRGGVRRAVRRLVVRLLGGGCLPGPGRLADLAEAWVEDPPLSRRVAPADQRPHRGGRGGPTPASGAARPRLARRGGDRRTAIRP